MHRTAAQRIRGNFFGGITAGIVALPLALAFGVASGAGAAAGLYGAIVLGLVAALAGGTPTQISGPTGPMTVVAAAALVAFHGDISALMLCVVIAGAVQMAMGGLKVGRFVRFLPYPVISGFMSGIGVIIILLQLAPLLGAPNPSSPMAGILALPEAVAGLNPAALGLGLLTMAIVFLTPARVTRVAPSPLIALLVGAGLSASFGLDVAEIGAIPHGLPALTIPHLPSGELVHVLLLGVTLALLGTIDTLLTSIVADSLTKDRHNPNRELFGQGLGNLLCGFVGGLPGAGATMRTVVNIKAGGTTRSSGVLHALLLLAVLLGLGPLASHIPMPVLAGILVKVGVDILDYRMLRVARRAPRSDLIVMATVFAVTVFVDLIVAVGVGVTLASLLLTWRIAKQSSIDVLGHDMGSNRLEAERDVQEDTDFAVRVVTVRGPFFFGSAASAQDAVARLIGTRVVLINCLEVPFMDLSAVFALGEMVERLKDSGMGVLLAVRDKQREQLRGLGFTGILAESDMFSDHDQALAAATVRAKDMGSGEPGLHVRTAPAQG